MHTSLLALAGYTAEQLASVAIVPIRDDDPRLCGVPYGSVRIVGQCVYVHATWWPRIRDQLALDAGDTHARH